MAERTVKAGEFKAKCLQIMDEVAATGDTVVVTKRGRAVVRLVPMENRRPEPSPFGFWKGKLELADSNDILFSAWDDEIEKAFQDGLATTARLIAPTTGRKVRKP